MDGVSCIDKAIFCPSRLAAPARAGKTRFYAKESVDSRM